MNLLTTPGLLIHLLWLLPLIWFLSFLASWLRRHLLARWLSSADLTDGLTSSLSIGARRARRVLFAGATVLLLVALAAPHWGKRLVERPIQSRDVMVVLDTSRSMLAADIQPNRLAHAQWLIRQIVTKCPGDRFGLVAFAGAATLQCPLTQDRNGFLLELENIDTDTTGVGGTNLAEGLTAADLAFDAAEGRHQAILLITDGDELAGDTAEILETLAQRNIRVFAVGIGNPQGELIQLPDGNFITHRGDKVKSRLNAAALQHIAEKSRGLYVHSTSSQTGKDQLVQSVHGLTPHGDKSGTVFRPIQRFQLPLAGAILLLLLRMCISERRRGPLTRAAMVGLLTVPFGWGQQPAPSLPPVSPPPPAQATPAQPQQPPKPSLQDEARGRAIKTLQKLVAEEAGLEIPEERALNLYNQGVQHMYLNEFELSGTKFKEAIDKAPGGHEVEVRAQQNLGYLKLKQSLAAPEAQAAAQGQAVMTLDRAQDELRQRLATSLNLVEEAEDHFRRAMRAAPDDEELAGSQEHVLLTRRKVHFAHQYNERHIEYAEALLEAYNQQRRANQADLEDKDERQKQAEESAISALDAINAIVRMEKLAKLEQEENHQKHIERQELLRQLQQVQQQALATDVRAPQRATHEQAAMDLLQKLYEQMPKAEQQENQQQQDQQGQQQPGDSSGEGEEGGDSQNSDSDQQQSPAESLSRQARSRQQRANVQQGDHKQQAQQQAMDTTQQALNEAQKEGNQAAEEALQEALSEQQQAMDASNQNERANAEQKATDALKKAIDSFEQEPNEGEGEDAGGTPEEQMGEAAEKAEDALDQAAQAQQRANEAQGAEKNRAQREAHHETSKAAEAARDLAEKAEEAGEEEMAAKAEQAAENLEDAQEAQERALASPTGSDAREEAEQEASEALAKAAGMDSEEPLEFNEEATPDRSYETEDIDKSQMMSILQKIAEREQDVKEALKEQRKRQATQVERDW